jgi:hypothetical protein
VAGHDLKGLNCYVNCNIEGLCFPLMCLLDYRGILFCSPRSPPAGSTLSFVIGSFFLAFVFFACAILSYDSLMLTIPLLCVGQRLIAISLIPIGPKTLVYGTSDASRMDRTIHFDDDRTCYLVPCLATFVLFRLTSVLSCCLDVLCLRWLPKASLHTLLTAGGASGLNELMRLSARILNLKEHGVVSSKGGPKRLASALDLEVSYSPAFFFCLPSFPPAAH